MGKQGYPWVKRVPRLCRTSRDTPALVSSAATLRLIAGWATPKRAAAREMLPSPETVAK
jgi:hypothetical protein